jgi:hypothetical protein
MTTTIKKSAPENEKLQETAYKPQSIDLYEVSVCMQWVLKRSERPTQRLTVDTAAGTDAEKERERLHRHIRLREK